MSEVRRPERPGGTVLLELRAGPGGADQLSVQIEGPAIPALPSLPEARQPAVDAGLAAIVAADPGFDRFRFLEMAKSRFGAVKAALAAWQPQPCRTFMTPALYQSWSAQVLDQAAHRIRNVFDDLQVGEPQLVWVQPGPSFQHVAVQLNATSLHYAFNEATRQLLFGDDDTMRAFTEYWTFSRPAGARTAAPAQAARCLLCGAPLLPGAQFCAYCKNAVTPPGGGWLVSRMDEELIWQDD